MDSSLFRALNSLAGHGWDSLIIFCASYLQYILGGLVVGAALWPTRRLRLLAVSLGAAFFARFGIKSLIIFFVHRARPFVALSDVRNIITPDGGENYQSFPSGHALFFFALAAAAYRYDRKLGLWLFAGASLMGLARIAGGAHWPSDVLVGALMGMLIGWATVRLASNRFTLYANR